MHQSIQHLFLDRCCSLTVIQVVVFVVMIAVTAVENEPLDVFDAIHYLILKMRQSAESRMHSSIEV